MMRLRVGASLLRGVRRLSSQRPVVELLGLKSSTPNDVVRRARLDPEEETPRFGKCLFARKFADDASRAFTREWGNAIGT